MGKKVSFPGNNGLKKGERSRGNHNFFFERDFLRDNDIGMNRTKQNRNVRDWLAGLKYGCSAEEGNEEGSRFC